MKQPVVTVCILPIFVLSVVCMSVPSCPPGQIQYKTKDSRRICCVPIVAPNFCGQHLRVQRCTEDGQPDKCVKCESGLVKFSNSTSGTEEDRCYQPLGCPEEAIPSLSEIDQCECDESRCYYGDPFGCSHISSKCEENTYHVNGACVPCREGTHRPGIGCERCEPMSSSAVLVINNSLSNLNSTNSPGTVPTEVPTKSSMPGLTNTGIDFVPEVNEAVDPGPLSGFPDWAVVLIVIVGLIFLAIIILGGVWCRRSNAYGLQRMPSNSSTSRVSTHSDGTHPLPPSYSQSQLNQNGHPCHINQNSGYCNGGEPERCDNQTARPFQNSRYGKPSQDLISGASHQFVPVQPSSTSSLILPPTGFSSVSSGPPDRVSMPGPPPDQTEPKVAAGGGERVGGHQGVLTKPSSGVVPVGDDAAAADPLLGPAPSLDPDSIKQDSQ